MQSIFSRAVIAVVLTTLLIGIVFDAEARRRGMRIEFDAWSGQLLPGPPDCSGMGADGVSWNGFDFRGSSQGQFSIKRYCQDALQYDAETNSDPTKYLNETIFVPPPDAEDEPGLADKIGANTDNSVTAKRFTFLNSTDFSQAEGFQWAFYDFGSTTLVTLYSDLNPGSFGFEPEIRNGDSLVWSGGLQGWNGEYWCFDNGEFYGIWDGEPAGSSALAGCQPVDTGCQFLELSHSGEGADPVATPPNSEDCLPGYYRPGETVRLSALPAPGWEAGWWDANSYSTISDSVIEIVILADGGEAPNYAGVTYQPIDWCDAYATGTRLFYWLDDDMESGAPGWSHYALDGVETWGLSGADFYSPGNAWGVTGGESTSDQVLESPEVIIPADADRVTLSFYNRRVFETVGGTCPDGGVLEYSTNGGTDWWRVNDWEISEHPYDGEIDSFTNPLGDFTQAWCGSSPWIRTEVDLSSLGLAGEAVTFRFRFGTDDANASEGWYIDNVSVLGCAPDNENYLLKVDDNTPSGIQILSPTGHGGNTNYGEFLAPGTVAELKAPLEADSRQFSGWTGCTVANGSFCSVTMTADTTVTANYAQECHLLRLGNTGPGADLVANPTNSEGCDSGYYVSGESVELTASEGPNGLPTGWSFIGIPPFQYQLSYAFARTATLTMPSRGASVFVHYGEYGRCQINELETTWFEDDLESGEGDWTHFADVGTDEWALEAGVSKSPVNAWHGPDSNPGNDPPDNSQSSDQSLVSPAINIPADATRPHMVFWNQRDFESGAENTCWDGAALELSTDGGSSWQEVGSADFWRDPYNGTLIDSDNPLAAGREVWCGAESWKRTEVDLSGQQGETLKFRFRFGTNSSVRQEGWYIDDVAVFDCEEPAAGDGVLTVIGSAPAPVEITSTSGHGGTANYHLSIPLDTVVALEAPLTVEGDDFMGWEGCDSVSGRTCNLTMTSVAELVTVNYAPACHALTLSHTGSGSDPVANYSNSFGCPAGEYNAGDEISLNAAADAGWEVAGWSGTDSDASMGPGQTLVMPDADHAVSVAYVEEADYCPAGAVEQEVLSGFTGFTSDWISVTDLGIGDWAFRYFPDREDTVSLDKAWNTTGAPIPSDSSLVSPAVPMPSSAEGVVFSFFQRHQLQKDLAFCNDAAVLEYSLDDGASWLPVETTDFVQNAYDNLVTLAANPLAADEPRDTWCGNKPWTRTVAYLTGLAGEAVKFRFRLGTDASVDSKEWRIDDVRVTACMGDMIFAEGFEAP